MLFRERDQLLLMVSLQLRMMWQRKVPKCVTNVMVTTFRYTVGTSRRTFNLGAILPPFLLNQRTQSEVGGVFARSYPFLPL